MKAAKKQAKLSVILPLLIMRRRTRLGFIAASLLLIAAPVACYVMLPRPVGAIGGNPSRTIAISRVHGAGSNSDLGPETQTHRTIQQEWPAALPTRGNARPRASSSSSLRTEKS